MPKASRKTATPLTRAEASARVLAMRKASGMSQTKFWALFGVSQSGGSRYETGRAIPKAVRMLMQDATPIGKQSESRDAFAANLNRLAGQSTTTEFLREFRAN